MNVTTRELSHIRACLRACQGVDIGSMLHFEEVKPLSEEEVNLRCEKLNCDEQANGHYTVVGLRSDSYWGDGMYEASFVTDVEAETALAAARKARLEAAASQCFVNKEKDPEAYAEELAEGAEETLILAAFEGALMDLYDPNAER